MIGAKAATLAESDHMGLCKAGPCIPCLVGVAIGLIDPTHACRGGTAADGHDLPMMEFNHCKSGNLRRGHLFGFAICTWHHHGTQQLHILGMSASEARARWGPSLFDQAKLFHDTFGSDDDLIEAQAFVLEQQGAACDSV